MTTLAFSSAGSKVYISAGTPATIDAAGFGALTFTEILLVSDIGMIGNESSLVTFNPVGTQDTQKIRGSRNAGSVDLKGGVALADPGQVILKAGEASNSLYALKIVLQTGTIIYAEVLVMGYKISVGAVNSVTSFESKLEVSGSIVVV